MKIVSWNVNGIRSAATKGLLDFIQNQSPDILCLQEIKAELSQLEPMLASPKGYTVFFNSAQKKGYSGVAIYTKKDPINVKMGFSNPRFNAEGRILIAEYEDFVLYNLYFPNGQKDQKRLDYKMAFNEELLLEVKKHGSKPIIICGDYNTAHQEMDLANPKSNEKTSGFLPMEREWVNRFLNQGFVDSYRYFHPDTIKYSWWTYRFNCRKKNIGWRIDYHCISKNLLCRVKSADILTEVQGSDHCPVTLELA